MPKYKIPARAVLNDGSTFRRVSLSTLLLPVLGKSSSSSSSQGCREEERKEADKQYARYRRLHPRLHLAVGRQEYTPYRSSSLDVRCRTICWIDCRLEIVILVIMSYAGVARVYAVQFVIPLQYNACVRYCRHAIHASI